MDEVEVRDLSLIESLHTYQSIIAPYHVSFIALLVIVGDSSEDDTLLQNREPYTCSASYVVHESFEDEIEIWIATSCS